MEWLLDYAATYPNPKLRFYASDMILHVDSDAAYLVLPNAKSRYAGYFYLSDMPPAHGDPNPKLNAPIHINCRIFRNTLSSSSECETGGVFFNCQEAIPIRISLEALNHPQPATPVKTDNSVAFSFSHANIRQRKSNHSPTYHTRVRSRYVLNKIASFPTLDLHCIVKNAVLHSQSCVRVC